MACSPQIPPLLASALTEIGRTMLDRAESNFSTNDALQRSAYAIQNLAVTVGSADLSDPRLEALAASGTTFRNPEQPTVWEFGPAQRRYLSQLSSGVNTDDAFTGLVSHGLQDVTTFYRQRLDDVTGERDRLARDIAAARAEAARLRDVEQQLNDVRVEKEIALTKLAQAAGDGSGASEAPSGPSEANSGDSRARIKVPGHPGVFERSGKFQFTVTGDDGRRKWETHDDLDAAVTAKLLKEGA